jgi:hypothetical protein
LPVLFRVFYQYLRLRMSACARIMLPPLFRMLVLTPSLFSTLPVHRLISAADSLSLWSEQNGMPLAIACSRVNPRVPIDNSVQLNTNTVEHDERVRSVDARSEKRIRKTRSYARGS